MAYFVGAYWGARKELRLTCAERLSKFLCAISEEDVALSTWFKKVSSRKAPLVEIPKDPELLSRLLKTNNRDIGGDAIVELGFNFGAWTGKDSGLVASFRMTCGAYSAAIRNSVVVTFESDAATPAIDLLQRILERSVAAFDPEDAVVSSTEVLAACRGVPASRAPAVFRYKRGSGFSLAADNGMFS